MDQDSDLTLIALLLGAAILATMLLLPRFTGRVTESPITFADIDLSNLKVGLDAFDVDVGRYPTTAEGLRALVYRPPGVAGWTHAYEDKVLSDPWGTPYEYRSPGSNGAPFDLYSCGPDGIPNTADDIR